jgi:hypothetical protein
MTCRRSMPQIGKPRACSFEIWRFKNFLITEYLKLFFFLIEFTCRFENDMDKFRQCVEDCVSESKRRLYDNPPINADDPYAIRFTKLDTDTFAQVKQDMRSLVNMRDKKWLAAFLFTSSFHSVCSASGTHDTYDLMHILKKTQMLTFELLFLFMILRNRINPNYLFILILIPWKKRLTINARSVFILYCCFDVI